MNTISIKVNVGSEPINTGDPAISTLSQIAAHVGGMTLALIRHYPINWAFHWSGIRRALCSEKQLARKREQEIRRKANGF